MLTTFALLSYLTASAFTAKTDLGGCTLTIVPLLTEITTATVDGVVQDVGNYQYSTFLWDGTEQCQLLDCGGGRAPPKLVPGCPGYTGTDTVPSLPFPTASLTLAAAGATFSSQASSAAAAASTTAIAVATPSSGPAATSVSATTTFTPVPSPTDTVVPSITSAPIAATSPNVTTSSLIQASDLNPTVTSSPNNALRDGTEWNMVLMGLAVVAMVART